MNEVLTVEQAKHIGGYTLMLIFNNGEKRKFDFSSLLDKGVCSKLRDMDYFKNFKVDAFSVDWNNESTIGIDWRILNLLKSMRTVRH